MPETTIDDAELTALRSRAEAADSAAATAEAAQAHATALQTQLDAGVARFAETLRAQHADIPADTITGDTFDTLAASAATARRIADAAAEHTRAAPAPGGAPQPRVPAGGANTRDDNSDVAGMSPAAKVAYGLTQRAQRTA